MRDITVELTRWGRIRYVTARASLYVFFVCITVLLSIVVVDDFIDLVRGRHVSGNLAWGIIGLPLCLLFVFLMPGRWVRQYPIFRASRLEINLGTVSMWSQRGELLAEMRRARVDDPLDGSIWFRSEYDDTDAFDVPLYLVCKSQQRELLAAVGLLRAKPDHRHGEK